MTGILTSKGITVRKGDSFTIVMQFKTPDGDLNIDGAEIKMRICTQEGQEVLCKSGSITDSAKGMSAIELSAEDTRIEPGDYRADIQVTYASGQVHTIYPQNIHQIAYFRITPDITE